MVFQSVVFGGIFGFIVGVAVGYYFKTLSSANAFLNMEDRWDSKDLPLEEKERCKECIINYYRSHNERNPRNN